MPLQLDDVEAHARGHADDLSSPTPERPGNDDEPQPASSDYYDSSGDWIDDGTDHGDEEGGGQDEDDGIDGEAVDADDPPDQPPLEPASDDGDGGDDVLFDDDDDDDDSVFIDDGDEERKNEESLEQHSLDTSSQSLGGLDLGLTVASQGLLTPASNFRRFPDAQELLFANDINRHGSARPTFLFG